MRRCWGTARCGQDLSWIAASLVGILAAMPALAAETAKAGPSEVVFLAQIIALLLTGRLLGEVMQRVGQPAVLGQLLAGIILGPSLLGALLPDLQHWLFPAVREQKSMIDAISQIGVLMLLLLTGMETDVTLVRRAGRAALSVSATGILIPFACGFLTGQLLPESMLPQPEHRLITSLFLGTALSISSVKIVAMVVREMKFMRRNLGQIIVASAIIDDTIGWIIIAVTFSLAQQGTVDFQSVATSVLGTGLFLIVSFTLGKRVVATLIRWANDTFVSDVPVLTTILVIMAAMALVTHGIGVHTVLGAFVAGILIGQSPILTQADRRPAARPDRGLLHADLLRHGGSQRRPHHPGRPAPAAVDPGADPDRQHWQVRRRVRRGLAGRAHQQGVARDRLRHQCARVHRGDRRHHRPVDGGAHHQSVHHDRDHGRGHHHGHAADAALGAAATTAPRGGARAAGARGDRRQGLRHPAGTPAADRRPQRQGQLRGAGGRDAGGAARCAQ